MVRILGSLLSGRHAVPSSDAAGTAGGARPAEPVAEGHGRVGAGAGLPPRGQRPGVGVLGWTRRGIGVVAAATMALTLFPSLASADAGGPAGRAVASVSGAAGRAADAVAAPAGIDGAAVGAARAGLGAGTGARASAAKAAARLAAGSVSQDVAASAGGGAGRAGGTLAGARGLMAAGTPATGGTAMPQIPLITTTRGLALGDDGTLYMIEGGTRVLVYTQVVTDTGRRFVLDPGATITGLTDAWDLTVDSDGTLYIGNPGANEVQVWDQSGQAGDYTYTKDTTATASLAMTGPEKALVDDDGTLYVSQAVGGTGRVSVWTRSGDWGHYTFTEDTGAAISNVNGPGGLAMDEDGTLFVSEQAASQISVWTRSGSVGDYTFAQDMGATAATAAYPQELAMDQDGTLYLTGGIQSAGSTPSVTVWTWTKDDTGYHLTQQTATITDPTFGGDALNTLYGIAVGGDGTVYVGDRQDGHVTVWNRSGDQPSDYSFTQDTSATISGFQGASYRVMAVHGDDIYLSSQGDDEVAVWRRSGTPGAYSYFHDTAATITTGSNWVYGLAVGPDDDLYVASGNKVLAYAWNGNAWTPDSAKDLNTGQVGQAGSPSGLAFGPDGKMYVGIYPSGRLEVLSYTNSAWTVDQTVAMSSAPQWLAVAPDGTVFVSNWAEDSITAWKPAADGSFGSTPTATISANSMYVGIAAVPTGATSARLYVGVQSLYAVQVFTWDGSTLTADTSATVTASASNLAIALACDSGGAVLGGGTYALTTPGYEVAGTVRDALTGAGVGGVTVTVNSLPTSAEAGDSVTVGSATTAEDGTYSITGVPNGTYIVNVGVDESYSGWKSSDTAEAQDGSTTITVAGAGFQLDAEAIPYVTAHTAVFGDLGGTVSPAAARVPYGGTQRFTFGTAKPRDVTVSGLGSVEDQLAQEAESDEWYYDFTQSDGTEHTITARFVGEWPVAVQVVGGAGDITDAADNSVLAGGLHLDKDETADLIISTQDADQPLTRLMVDGASVLGDAVADPDGVTWTYTYTQADTGAHTIRAMFGEDAAQNPTAVPDQDTTAPARATAFDPSSNLLYAVNAAGTAISVWQTATVSGNTTYTPVIDGGITGLDDVTAIAAAGGLLYVAQRSNGTVAVYSVAYDYTTGAYAATSVSEYGIQTGGASPPIGVAVDSATGLVYVTDDSRWVRAWKGVSCGSECWPVTYTYTEVTSSGAATGAVATGATGPLAADPDTGLVYIATSSGVIVRQMTATASGTGTTYSWASASSAGLATTVTPTAVTVAASGLVYVATGAGTDAQVTAWQRSGGSAPYTYAAGDTYAGLFTDIAALTFNPAAAAVWVADSTGLWELAPSLVPQYVVTGQVTSTDSKALPDPTTVDVIVPATGEGADPTVVATGVTEADGSFSFPWVPIGSGYEVRAAASLHLTGTSTAFNVTDADGAGGIAVSLVPCCTVTDEVTGATTGGHGDITLQNPNPVEPGSDFTVTVTPEEGYHLSALTDKAGAGNAADVLTAATEDENGTWTYTIQALQADHLVTATFAIDTFTVTASAAGGMIDPDGATEVGWGQSQKFTFTPDDDVSAPVSVTVDGEAVDAADIHAEGSATWSYTLENVTAAHTVVAWFNQPFDIDQDNLNGSGLVTVGYSEDGANITVSGLSDCPFQGGGANPCETGMPITSTTLVLANDLPANFHLVVDGALTDGATRAEPVRVHVGTVTFGPEPVSPIALTGGANLTLTLDGTTTLQATGVPAVAVPAGAALTINGAGNNALIAKATGNAGTNAAGIGGHSAGRIDIESGTVIASAGIDAAGIGGGPGGAAGDITIGTADAAADQPFVVAKAGGPSDTSALPQDIGAGAAAAAVAGQPGDTLVIDGGSVFPANDRILPPVSGTATSLYPLYVPAVDDIAPGAAVTGGSPALATAGATATETQAAAAGDLFPADTLAAVLWQPAATYTGIMVGVAGPYGAEVTAGFPAHTDPGSANWLIVSSYTITASVTGGVGGTIDPAGGVKVRAGANQRFTFAPSTGMAVTRLVIDGGDPVQGNLPNDYTFPHVTGDHTIEVTFGSAAQVEIKDQDVAGYGEENTDPVVTIGFDGDTAFTITGVSDDVCPNGGNCQGLALGASRVLFTNLQTSRVVVDGGQTAGDDGTVPTRRNPVTIIMKTADIVSANGAPLTLTGGANVRLLLWGASTFEAAAAAAHPGIEVPAGSQLTIDDYGQDGPGQATVQGGAGAAGIGGGPQAAAGSVILESGMVKTIGGPGGAGLGGGQGGDGGGLRATGGTLEAIGGQGGAGIGGGQGGAGGTTAINDPAFVVACGTAPDGTPDQSCAATDATAAGSDIGAGDGYAGDTTPGTAGNCVAMTSGGLYAPHGTVYVAERCDGTPATDPAAATALYPVYLPGGLAGQSVVAGDGGNRSTALSEDQIDFLGAPFTADGQLGGVIWLPAGDQQVTAGGDTYDVWVTDQPPAAEDGMGLNNWLVQDPQTVTVTWTGAGRVQAGGQALTSGQKLRLQAGSDLALQLTPGFGLIVASVELDDDWVAAGEGDAGGLATSWDAETGALELEAVSGDHALAIGFAEDPAKPKPKPTEAPTSAAPGGGGTAAEPPAQQPPAQPPAPPSVVVSKIGAGQKALVLVKGKSAKLVADAIVAGTTGTLTAVTWTSLKPAVVTVSASGKVKAKKPGKATVTASAGGKTLKVKVTVLKKKTGAKVTAVSGKVPKTLKVSHGPYWVTGKWKNAKAPGVVVKFAASKKSVAAIDKAGLLTPKKPGKAVIKVKAGSKAHAYKITVKK